MFFYPSFTFHLLRITPQSQLHFEALPTNPPESINLSIFIYKTVVCDRVCVCVRILSAACVSRRHTPRSPGTRQFPDRSPKFGFAGRQSFTALKVPILNSQNHIFPLAELASFPKCREMPYGCVFEVIVV